MIGKSLASLLAGAVGSRGLSAIWLTPLLTVPAVIADLAKVRQPMLLAGGSADPTWRLDAIPANPVLDVVELAGVDHSLQVPGDPIASLEARQQLTRSIIEWL